MPEQVEVANLITKLIADVSQFKAGFQEAEGSSQSLLDKFSSHAVKIGAAATGLGATLEHFADPMEKSEATLKAVLENSGSSFDAMKGQIDATVSHMENFGHTSSDTETALANLTTRLGDPQKALADMSVVAEVAAAKHISLAAAADLVGKAEQGNSKILKQFGIDVTALASVQAAAKKADDEESTAKDNLAKATQKLSDLKEIDSTKTKLTVADQIALRNAQQAVTEDTAKYNDAVQKATDANNALSQATANSKDYVTQIGDKLKGVAENQANTFGGKMDALKAKVEDLAGSIGQKVGPALVTMGPALSGIGGILSSELIPKTVEAIKSFVEFAAEHTAEAATFVAENVAMAASATAAFVAENAATLGIVAGIAALVAGIVWVATHWSESWNAIKGAVSDAVGFIEDHWRGIVEILLGPIGFVVVQIVDHWNQIRDGFQSVWNWLVGAWNSLVGFIGGIPGRISSAASGMFDGIKDAFREAIDFIIRGWNALHFTMPSIDTHIPGIGKVGGFDLGLPQIPLLDSGGIVSSPTIAMLAGNSRPEVVIPLDKLGSAGGGGGGMTNITLMIDGRVLADIMHENLLSKQRRSGNLGFEAP